MEQKIGHVSIDQHDEERDNVRAKEPRRLHDGQDLGLTQRQATPRYARPSAMRPPPLEHRPKGRREQGDQEGDTGEELPSRGQSHQREDQRRTDRLKCRESHAGHGDHHRRRRTGHARIIQGVHIKEPMEGYDQIRKEECKTYGIDAAQAHGGVCGVGKQKRENGDERDPFQEADLREDHGQTQNQAAKDRHNIAVTVCKQAHAGLHASICAGVNVCHVHLRPTRPFSRPTRRCARDQSPW